MSQLTIEAVGDCHKGNNLVVGDCANQPCTDHYVACQDKKETTEYVIYPVFHYEKLVNKKEWSDYAWWVFAAIAITSIVVIVIAHAFRKRDY